MTYETYTSLLRVAEKRKRSARVVGDWKAMAEACAEIMRLHNEYAKANPTTL